MADDEKIKVHSDIPTGSGMVIRNADDAKRAAIMLSGELPANRERYYCMTCGQDKTLEFEDDEMAAMAEGVRAYSGPCWGCGFMTLVPYDTIGGNEMSINARASANKRKDYKEQAEVQAEVFGTKILETMAASAMAMSDVAAPAAETVAPAGPPGRRDDLPETVDTADLKPREGA